MQHLFHFYFLTNEVPIFFFHVCFNGKTAIHFACENNKIDVLKYLLGLDLDLNAKNNTGETPLHYASKNSIEHIKLLLEKKIDVNVMDSNDFIFFNLLMKYTTSQRMPNTM